MDVALADDRLFDLRPPPLARRVARDSIVLERRRLAVPPTIDAELRDEDHRDGAESNADAAETDDDELNVHQELLPSACGIRTNRLCSDRLCRMEFC